MSVCSDGSGVERLRQLMSVLDLTHLSDTPGFSIADFCGQVMTPLGCVAAVCVLPDAVRDAKRFLLHSGVRVATVVNFPKPHLAVAEAVDAIGLVLDAGVDEVDVVMPYEAIISGNIAQATAWLKACREACSSAVCLKVILETGALNQAGCMLQAANCALDAGADFLKTSTGVGFAGASVSVVQQLVACLHAHGSQVGLKVSGGIRTVAQAEALTAAWSEASGEAVLAPDRYRIGASGLHSALIAEAIPKGVVC